MNAKKKPEWVDASEAVRHIQKGKRLFIGSLNSEPHLLIDALLSHSYRFSDNEVVQLFSRDESPLLNREYKDSFRYNPFYLGLNQKSTSSLSDCTPVFLADIPGLFKTGQMPIHCALIQVSQPTAQGEVSLGLNVDVNLAAIKAADIVIAQVNKNLPDTCGKSRVPNSLIDFFVEGPEPLVEIPAKAPDAASKKIGKLISELIHDGDTIQLRKGPIHNAVAANLLNKKDLGLHSDMISDSAMTLIKKGVVTNKHKTTHPGVTVASFAMGSKTLYNFVDHNKDVEFHPSNNVNSVFSIAKIKNMVAINTAIQIDLTGQVASDGIGPKFFGGMGGQVSFVRGARLSKGGRSIIALPSTAKNGTISRIVPKLQEGGVMVTRDDIEYVVTEYGVAYLHGKTNRERGLALVEIAHPKFREQLLKELKKRHYVYSDQIVLKQDTQGLMDMIQHSQKFGDKTIYFRLLYPSDERALQDFFYSHSQETIYNRYKQYVSSMHHEEAQKRVNVDFSKEIAIAGFESDVPYSQLVCIGRYTRQSKEAAELNMLVKEEYQKLGIGKFLLSTMLKTAKYQKIKELYADILISNVQMAKILKKHKFKDAGKPKHNIQRFNKAI